MSDTPRINAVLQTNLIRLEAGSAMKDVIAAIRLLATSLTDEGKKLERELADMTAERDLLRDGRMSDPLLRVTFEALTKERDEARECLLGAIVYCYNETELSRREMQRWRKAARLEVTK